jgi:hypothetical protein
MFIQRKIVEIFDNDLAKPLYANDILNNLSHDDYVLLRRRLKKRIKTNDPYYLCDKCGTPLELSCTPNGQGSHEFFFRHFRDPDFDKCPIKTNIQRTEQEILRDQYAFKKESKPHIRLKETVSRIIRAFIDPNVIVDSKYINDRFGDDEKRKPDIYFKNGERELVIEFQVNNTFHSVIEEREAFYERNCISLFWVFGAFNPFGFQSITTKDIYIPNYNNAFVFDEEAEQESMKRKNLCLKVFYKIYAVERSEVIENWMQDMIEINDLLFNEQTHRPFFANCPELKQLALLELEKSIDEEELKKSEKMIQQKITEFKEFLSNFKKDDSIHNNWLYYLTNYSKYELEKLNAALPLKNFQRGGKDIFQVLLEEGKHPNLVQFLLRAQQLDIYVNVAQPDTTLTTLLKSQHIYKHDLVKSLFLRGYRLTESDILYISERGKGFESAREIQKYRYYEQMDTRGGMDLVAENLNELLVIECAKQRKIELLGNGVQGAVWLGNLAITQYAKYWPIFDAAFKKYNFYQYIFSQDLKGSFKRKLLEFEDQKLETYPFFETIVKKLFPELREDPNYPDVTV